jgi:phosphatidylglycerophosphate synthase
MAKYSIKEIASESKGTIDCSSRIVSDVFSILLSYLILNFTSISANAITLGAFFFGFIGSLSICYDQIILAIICYHFSFILDFTDGKVARKRNTSSGLGKALDMGCDRLVFLMLSLAYGHYLIRHDLLEVEFMLLLFVLLFLTLDILELLFTVGNFYDGVPLATKKEKDKEVPYLAVFFQPKKWFPSRLLLLFVAFYLIPLFNFNIYLFYILNLVQLYYFLRHIYKNYIKALLG